MFVQKTGKSIAFGKIKKNQAIMRQNSSLDSDNNFIDLNVA